MSAPKQVTSSYLRTCRRAAETSSRNLVERLPPEILIKILSYLDASALFSVSHVNKLLCQLANDNALWNKIYIAKYGKNKKSQELQDRVAGGYWKWLLFRTVAARDMNKWNRHLGLVSRHTGLPSHTERVLSPGWRSLMAELEVQTLTKSAQVIGRDRLVEMKLLQPGIIIGTWRDQCSVAFIAFTLHFHRLVERSIQGSSSCPYVEPLVKTPFDDIDPQYGLHGYQLHIVLHNTECKLMSGSFAQLFCRRTQICDGLIQLTAISRTNLSQHTPLSGSVTLPWRCEALQGAVENCCIMSLTLLDEFRKPFWCVSSPVSMQPEETPVSYDYDGEHFLIHYLDSDGQVKVTLVWMKEQFVVISLVVYMSVSKVNKHFSTDY
ncbi:F-box only protein 15 isoform X2 [Scophthalmus maximus]|uniref:F-box only protein 15 isoform X2 n=1 Tax=Scophthalmus maximus TaxID=52904 RepID=UPI001FA826C0|nr:F-box only protein 15 isoform X2 [Scophthalmus maximus]